MKQISGRCHGVYYSISNFIQIKKMNILEFLMLMDFVIWNKAKVFQFLFKYPAATSKNSLFMSLVPTEYPWAANRSLAVSQSTVSGLKE